MFEIEYKGGNSVIISAKKAKIVTDPKISVVGLKDLSTKGAVELNTEDRFATDNPDALLVIKSPGDYGVAGFDIHGVAAKRSIDDESEGMTSTMYRVEVDGARIGIIGNIHNKLTDEQLEELGVLDVLVIPVGGNGYTLDAVDAAALVRMIGPKVVVPVHYKDESIKYEVPQDDLSLFIKDLGAPVEETAKYKFKPSAAPSPLVVAHIIRS
ncbi:Zn-dependent hydrolase [Candidatus Saccharibacteria bacterium]|nr:Zn-dependent hydrolase [Candidatus Saccharibacteria bacterium]